MNRLVNKWALVTGSSRGIGQQIVIGLAKEGCNVIVHARSLDNLKATLHKLKPYPVKVLSVAGELGNIEDEENISAFVRQKVKGIDILYNNAAIMSDWKDSLFDISNTEWHKTFEVNVFSMVRLCRMFIPYMIKNNWGRVINLSSGIADTPQLSPYSVSKAAVDKYTKDLAFELKGTNVIASMIDPGWLKTDLGGEHADYEVESVLPGALVPVFLDDGEIGGKLFCAQDYRV